MDLQLLKSQLIEAGQLSDFMDSLGVTNGLYNCTTEKFLPSNGEVAGNIFCRQMVLNTKGCVFEGHRHNYDHVTYIIRGKVTATFWNVDSEGKKVDSSVYEVEYQAPAKILILKGKAHKFTAMTDDVIAECIYALRDEKGDVTETFIGSMYPYV